MRLPGLEESKGRESPCLNVGIDECERASCPDVSPGLVPRRLARMKRGIPWSVAKSLLDGLRPGKSRTVTPCAEVKLVANCGGPDLTSKGRWDPLPPQVSRLRRTRQPVPVTQDSTP